MKTRTPDQVLDEIARSESGSGIPLSSALHAQIRKDNQKIMKRKSFLNAAAAFALVAVVLLSIPSMAQAVKKLFGYLPGAGIVEEDLLLRVLKEPQTVTTEAGTIVVEQAVADPSRTIVSYRLENIPDSGSDSLTFTDYCRELPWLKLADGTILDPGTIGGDSWASGLSRQIEYPALPAAENKIILGFNCIEGTALSLKAQPIEIELEFVAAPPEMTVYPVVELPTSQPSETALPEESTAASLPVSLILKKYVQTDQELILLGAVQTDASDFRLSYVDGSAVHLIDSSGFEIPLVEDASLPDPDIQALSGQVWPLTYRIEGAYTPGTAVMRVDELWVSRDSAQTFTLDIGTDPQPGQTFTLNQQLEDRGHIVTIQDVAINATGDGLDINYEISDGMANPLILDANHELLGGGGGDVNTGFTYREGLPTGEITLVLASYDEKVAGPWQATLDLPAYTGDSQPTPVPEACLTQSTWESALANPSSIPQELGGTLLLKDILPPTYTYHVMSGRLDGSEALDLVSGSDGSLSPDGKSVVYATDNGLALLSLETGQSTAIPDTSKRDRWPVWSTDGSLIAFTRAPLSGVTGGGAGPYTLMLMNSDGSGVTELLANGDANYAQAWLPGEKSLLFTTMTADGVTIKTINVETGEITVWRDVNYQSAGVAVSPDGSRIAIETMLPGERYGIVVSNLDGSQEKLIVNGDPIVITSPYWSPDGQWLAVSVHDTAMDENRATLALVNPFTCQVIPVTSLHGYVTGWR